MAINILSKPAMSSEPERVFSPGLDLRCSVQRNSSQRLRGLSFSRVFESRGFRLGIFTEEDWQAVVNDLDENGATEALDYESGLV